MARILSVHVRKDRGIFYVSEPHEYGWICGKCGRGNLGFTPKKRDQCKVCKARVCQVATENDAVIYGRGCDHES